MKGKSNTKLILQVMHVLAWIAFIVMCVETGAMLFSFITSLFGLYDPSKLYIDLQLADLHAYSEWHYIDVASLVVGFSAAKAYAAYLMIKIFGKLDLSQPFEGELAKLIEKVSHVILGMAIIALISNAYADWLNHRGVQVPTNENVGEILFLAGIIFVVAQIFKKGIELQTENELTI